MPVWQQDALAAGFDVGALTTAADLIAGHVIDLDGPALEEVPGFWVIPGFLPYEGRTILVTVDRTHVDGGADVSRELGVILGRAVADRPPDA
jgi:hypothetical protein